MKKERIFTCIIAFCLYSMQNLLLNYETNDYLGPKV
jgi:hypothetical protein